MNILLSNDDGYQAQGLINLLNGLNQTIKHPAKIIAVAPEVNCSGASSSLTLSNPLRLTKRSEQLYSVNGTPVDCIHMALTGLLDQEPDILISGINHGANMGDDVIYSGTVAAAIEGRFLGLPSLAVSLNATNNTNLPSAVKAINLLLRHISRYPADPDIILNINVPDLPWQTIKGFQSTHLGKRHRSAPIIKSKDARNNDIYWIGSAGKEYDAGEGTDFHAIKHGFISVTPIHIDLTRYPALNATSDWLKDIN